MANHEEQAGTHDRRLRLLNVATLSRKLTQGVSLEELYSDAERKFDTMTELLNGGTSDGESISGFGYSLDELREASLKAFSRLISEQNTDPYMTLCVSKEAPPEEVKRRRNRLLQIFHPDRAWASWTDEAITRRINDAYEAFLNKNKDIASHIKMSRKEKPLSFAYRNRQDRKRRRLIIAAFVVFVLSWALFLKLLYF